MTFVADDVAVAAYKRRKRLAAMPLLAPRMYQNATWGGPAGARVRTDVVDLRVGAEAERVMASRMPTFGMQRQLPRAVGAHELYIALATMMEVALMKHDLALLCKAGYGSVAVPPLHLAVALGFAGNTLAGVLLLGMLLRNRRVLGRPEGQCASGVVLREQSPRVAAFGRLFRSDGDLYQGVDVLVDRRLETLDELLRLHRQRYVHWVRSRARRAQASPHAREAMHAVLASPRATIDDLFDALDQGPDDAGLVLAATFGFAPLVELALLHELPRAVDACGKRVHTAVSRAFAAALGHCHLDVVSILLAATDGLVLGTRAARQALATWQPGSGHAAFETACRILFYGHTLDMATRRRILATVR